MAAIHSGMQTKVYCQGVDCTRRMVVTFRAAAYLLQLISVCACVEATFQSSFFNQLDPTVLSLCCRCHCYDYVLCCDPAVAAS
jgi:hypothetical protein